MSIHSSLRAGDKGKKHRSVLKRYERLKVLKEKNLWNEEVSVFGIPKVKVQKIKIKKEKAAVEGEPAAGKAPGAEGEPAAAPAAAPTAGGKAPAAPKAAAPAKKEKK